MPEISIISKKVNLHYSLFEFGKREFLFTSLLTVWVYVIYTCSIWIWYNSFDCKILLYSRNIIAKKIIRKRPHRDNHIILLVIHVIFHLILKKIPQTRDIQIIFLRTYPVTIRKFIVIQVVASLVVLWVIENIVKSKEAINFHYYKVLFNCFLIW